MRPQIRCARCTHCCLLRARCTHDVVRREKLLGQRPKPAMGHDANARYNQRESNREKKPRGNVLQLVHGVPCEKCGAVHNVRDARTDIASGELLKYLVRSLFTRRFASRQQCAVGEPSPEGHEKHGLDKRQQHRLYKDERADRDVTRPGEGPKFVVGAPAGVADGCVRRRVRHAGGI